MDGQSNAVSQRYPETLMPFAALLPEQERRFAELREDLLLDYGYNTARAYWGDLEHIRDWANERDKDVLGLSEKDLKQYCALLRRRKYSESTIRRRWTSWNLLSAVLAASTPLPEGYPSLEIHSPPSFNPGLGGACGRPT
jgi:hypothetical protein